MLANLFFCLLFLGFVFSLPVVEKYKKISSLMFTVCIVSIFFSFFQVYQNEVFGSFSFFWMRTQKYRLEININSDLNNYIKIMPVFIVSILMAIYVSFLPKAQYERRVYSLIAFNLANMILLISSKNLVQLLTCICLSDIIGQIMIKNSSISKKYIFYNLFANLGLFMVFAMIQGKLKSFDLDVVGTYKNIGRHRDFVAISILLFTFIKMGLFLFQNVLLDLKNIATYKLSFISYFSGVLGGFFALCKIYPVLQISTYSLPMLQSEIFLSAVYGFICGIIMGGINRKLVYFSMLLHAFMLYVFMQMGVYTELLSYTIVLGVVTVAVFSINNKYLNFILRLLCLASWIFVFYRYKDNCSIEMIGLEILILASVIFFGNIRFFYKYSGLQKAEYFNSLYDILFVKPTMILGRTLWILVDFMIMERHVGGIISEASNISSGYIEKISKDTLGSKLFWFSIVLLMFFLSFYIWGAK